MGAKAGNGPGALLTSLCLAQHHPLQTEHREMQNESISVWIPKLGERGLMLGRT